MSENINEIKALLEQRTKELQACEAARRRVEEALRESEEKFSRVFRNAPIAITISTLAEGRFVEVNDTFERLSGYRREEIIGRTSTELGIWTNPDDRGRMLEGLRGQGPVRDLEMSMGDKTGNVYVGLLSAVIIELNGEEYILVLMKDITARKRMEEEIEILNTDLASRAADLEAANKELEAFSYSVSHDLRKPLTNINGYCQLVLELYGGSLDERCRGFLQEIYDGTLHMNHLIDTLLRFSLLTRAELHRETVDLSGIAREVAAELSMEEPGRRVKFDIAEGITVNGDTRLLRVVMENLLGNAWKYSGKQEEALIEFGVTEVAGKPVCFVRDNGIGFDMGEADRLFDAFGRLSGATDFAGHGIGLATVQRIIHRHGGHIWAEGEVGKGATFYFSLER